MNLLHTSSTSCLVLLPLTTREPSRTDSERKDCSSSSGTELLAGGEGGGRGGGRGRREGGGGGREGGEEGRRKGREGRGGGEEGRGREGRGGEGGGGLFLHVTCTSITSLLQGGETAKLAARAGRGGPSSALLRKPAPWPFR